MSDLSRLSDGELRRLGALLEARRSPASLGAFLGSGYVVRGSHRVIGDALADLGARRGLRKLMVLAPPRAGKSELVTKMFPLWWLGRNPSDSVVAAAYGSDLAKKWGRDVRSLVRRHGGLLGLELSADSRSAQAWQLVSGGGMRTTGVGAGLTGHDADLLICDDPHKNREEASSRVARDRVWDWWTSTFITRQSPGTPICLILTRWHEDDLAGRLLASEGDEWRVIRLPAIADSDDDPLGRSKGDPLPHPKIDDDRLELLAFWESMRRNVSTRDWFSMYQADPQPVEGALLTSAQVQACRHPVGEPVPGRLRTAVAVDPSGTSGGDEAGIVVGFLGEDDRAWVVGDYTRQCSPTEWAREAMLVAAENAADVVFVENNFGGELAANQLKAAWSDLEDEEVIDEGLLMPRIEQVRARYGKRIRAEPVAQYFVQGDVSLVGDLTEFEREWTTWQSGSRESPGRIDASVYLIAGLLKNVSGGPARVVEPVVGESIFGGFSDWVTSDLW